MFNVQKFYDIAKRYVGDLNKDLVHHTFIKIDGRIPKTNPDGYFYRSMKNELRSDSTFRKQYDSVKTIPEPVSDEEITLLDTDRVQSILNDISNEGFRLEVKVFIELATESSSRELSGITGVRRDNLLKIRNFVKTEILKRYGDID